MKNMKKAVLTLLVSSLIGVSYSMRIDMGFALNYGLFSEEAEDRSDSDGAPIVSRISVQQQRDEYFGLENNVAAISVCGTRKENQDRFKVIPNGFMGIPTSAYFALFDGHGDSVIVADILKEKLHLMIEKSIKGYAAEHQVSITSREAIIAGIKHAFDLMGKKMKNFDSGSTAIVVLLIQNNLYVANVGDSRAVLIKKNGIISLNIEHRPDTQWKRNYLMRWLSDNGVNYPGMNLRLFRSNTGQSQWRFLGKDGLGNYSLYAAFGDQDNLKRDVDITEFNITGGKFIFMATDGVWDAFKSAACNANKGINAFEADNTNEACDVYVQQLFSENLGMNAKELANKLINFSIERAELDSRVNDNFSVVIANLELHD